MDDFKAWLETLTERISREWVSVGPDDVEYWRGYQQAIDDVLDRLDGTTHDPLEHLFKPLSEEG